MPEAARWGWLSDYPEVQKAPPDAIIVSLQEFLAENNPSQLKSWRESVPIVQREAGVAVEALELAKEFSAVLEYELPREGGRRPDVVALQNGVVVVIEFKERNVPLSAHVDQVQAYARDLKNYHEMSHELEVIPVLIPTAYKGQRAEIAGVSVLRPNDLGAFLVEHAGRNTGKVIDAKEWVNSIYAPLPSLVSAARLLFQRQELPRIKRAHSARIPDVVNHVLAICHEAAATETKHLVFLTGTPGSGKTLVGLQLAHSERLEDLRVARGRGGNGAPAVFLSGNGPLVEVLQDALGSRAFVDGMKKFIEYYSFKRPELVPSEHVLIFDEAQRAWDEDHMEAKHGTRMSEPRALLQIASRLPKWSVVFALVGEGQEIHKGEEAGLIQWKDAVQNLQQNGHWVIHGPEKLEAMFSGNEFHANDLLNLTTTLRSHLASNLHKWVGMVLSTNGRNLSELRTSAMQLRDEGFSIYVTRSLEEAKQYARARYEGATNSRYGLLASRYAKNLRSLGVDNTYHFQRAEQLKVGPWFNQEPLHPLSACALARPATEFECQGLELDFPIVCWGDDILWNTNGWFIEAARRRSVKNPVTVTTNAYRVLLTRGRDGMFIFVPPGDKFDATFNLLVAAGGLGVAIT